MSTDVADEHLPAEMNTAADMTDGTARATVTELSSPERGRRRVEVVVDGWQFEIDIEDAARAELRRRATRDPSAAEASGPAEIRAIIPGPSCCRPGRDR